VQGGAFDDPMIGGLIQICQFGDAARLDFKAGRSELWSLVPPIDALQIQERGLEIRGVRALSVPIVLQGRHALHHFKEVQEHGIPEPLVDVEYLCGVLLRSMDSHPETQGSKAQKRLEILLADLEVRSGTGVSEEPENDRFELPERKSSSPKSRASSEKKKAASSEADKEEEHEQSSFEEEDLTADVIIQKSAESAVARASFTRIIFGLLLIGLLGGLYYVLPAPGGGYPQATSYNSMPLIGVIRHPGQVKVRVHGSWFTLPDEERDIAVMILWDQLVDETEDRGLELTVADHTNQTRGGVVAGKVWWRLH
jgi:hypothetical protein